jgi:hypothetical protein
MTTFEFDAVLPGNVRGGPTSPTASLSTSNGVELANGSLIHLSPAVRIILGGSHEPSS